MTRRRIGALAAAAAAGALAIAGATAWRERARLRHLAVPVLVDPSIAPAPAAALGSLPAWPAEELARVGSRVTALLRASDGVLWIGTFDTGVLRVEEGGAPVAVEGLEGRERFVNALAEHDGTVWVATQGGLLAFDDGRRVGAMLAGEAVTALARAGEKLYAGTARGIFCASIDGGAEAIAATGPEGEPLRVSALAASVAAPGAPGGRLWIGTAAGAYALAVASLEAPLLARTATWYPLVFGDPPAETDVVTALAPLPDGGAVAGTDDGGFARISPGGAVAALRLADPRADEVNPGAAAALEGGAVLGTQGGGLVFARARGGAIEAARPAGLERAAISAVWSGGGELLVGTAEGAVLRLAPAGIASANQDRT